MKVLVVGGGGREHALAWKCALSDRVETVYVAPGNAGTARESKCENISVSVDDTDGLVAFAVQNAVDLTIIGPEAPLVAGIVDAFQAAGLRCFGPTAKAAQLEGSKSYTKAFLQRHAIPTAGFETFTEVEAAKEYVRQQGAPIVVKADGLAAGKGVIVAQTEEEAFSAIDDILTQGAFGAAGASIVIEECLVGEEISFIAIVDGDVIVPLATSQDHKARDNGDRGPNTGGMGAYSPAPLVNEALEERIMREVMRPTVEGLVKDGARYSGFLYAGLMVAPDGTPNVLEFNCRLGDPETQPILMRMQSDLTQACDAVIDGRLDQLTIEWDERCSVGVVMAAGGYPNTYEKGHPIVGLETIGPRCKVFHAGTVDDDGVIKTAGGRVLCVCGLGDTVKSAQSVAYDGVAQISWKDAYYRTDIGYRAIARE